MHRKVVTVPFCDVVGSTALGESTDPEALQGLLSRYFEERYERKRYVAMVAPVRPRLEAPREGATT